MQVGDIINFDQYQWRILAIKKQSMLLLAENMIGQRPYHNGPEAITWADCELRRYLNGEFLASFSVSSRKRMLSVKNKTPNNPWYGSEGGETTKDTIFLLSLDETVRYYFGDSSQNLDTPSPKQRYWFQRKDPNNHQRRSNYLDSSWWWWLRTPGRDNKRAIYIHGDGNIGIQGNKSFKYSSTTLHPFTGDNSGGLRPAVWVKI